LGYFIRLKIPDMVNIPVTDIRPYLYGAIQDSSSVSASPEGGLNSECPL